MLTHIKYFVMLCCITLFISSCATLNKDECKTANWKTIGYEDGAKGYRASRISKHRSACAEYGISPDLTAYTTGRNKGLSQYCIPATGYRKGLSGYKYNGICTNHNERVFLDAYHTGLAIHKEITLLNKMKIDYTKEQNYIFSLEREIHEKEHDIVNGRLSKVKALILLNETKEMAEEIGKAKSNLLLLADDINSQSQHVEHLKRQSNHR